MGTQSETPEPDRTIRLKSRQQAEAVTGPLRRLRTGEGFTVDVASSHFAAGDESSLRAFADDETGAMLEVPVSLHRFASPMARRLWLMDRQLLMDGWPEAFRVETGSGFPTKTSIWLESGALTYERAEEGQRTRRRIDPTPSAWNSFWSELDAIGVWNWRPSYLPAVEHMTTDNYGWDLVIAFGGRTVQARGYMTYPTEGSQTLDRSPEWEEFLAALRSLVGGLPVD